MYWRISVIILVKGSAGTRVAVASPGLPINAKHVLSLPNNVVLYELGVKRISMGNFWLCRNSEPKTDSWQMYFALPQTERIFPAKA
jgi:hypothetical protein